MSSLETRIQRCRSGSTSMRSISSRFCSSTSTRLVSSARAVWSRAASASRTRSRSRTPSTRGPPAAGTPNSMPARGNAVANSSPSSRSRSPIWRRRSWRASRSASSRTLAWPPPAGETGGPAGAGSVRTLCSSSSGISPIDERGSSGFYSPPARSDTPITSHASHNASSAAMSGTPLTWVVTSIVLRVLERTPRPLAIAPNSSAIGLASSAITSVPAGSSPGLPSSPSPGAEPLNPTAPSTLSASNALIATPDSTIAIVSASSSRFRLRKPPCFMRSRAACSTGVRVRSASLGPSAVGAGAAPRLPEQPRDLIFQRPVVELLAADARAPQDAAGVCEGDRGTYAHAVDVAHGSVGVVTDWDPPSVLANHLAHLIAIVANVHAQEVDPATVPRGGLGDEVLRGQTIATAAEPERDDERLVEEVAHAQDLGQLDLACRRSPLILGAGNLRALAVVLVHVRVPLHASEGVRHRELGQRRPAVSTRAEQPPLGRADGVQERKRDQRDESRPDDKRIDSARPRASGGIGLRAHRSAPRPAGDGAPRRRRAHAAMRGNGWKPPSAHTSVAGRTIITPSSATPRSTTVTIPKSRSILISVAISAAKPAIAVSPEASTAAPVRE